MTDAITTEERKGVSYEELVERFREKVAGIPEECHEAVMFWRLAKEVQEARIAAEHKLRQTLDIGKKVFWADEVPEQIQATMANLDQNQLRHLRKTEERLTRACEKAFKATRWYNEVALPAAEGFGLGPMLAGDFLWYLGTASRFSTFGKLVRYAGLDVTPQGHAPKRRKGHKITYNPNVRTALYKLTEVWLRSPDSTWRAMWDAHKVWYAESRPEWPRGKVHNAARRKVQREFLRNLYHLWLAYESEQEVPECGEIESAS